MIAEGFHTGTMEGTVYFQGAKMRDEVAYSVGGAVMTTISRCDQKRIVSVLPDNRCLLIAMQKTDSCSGQTDAPRKGGVVTKTTTVTDTGERQEMFGYTARHIKSTTVQRASSDACNQQDATIESDGWYADVSPEFTCDDDIAHAMNCLPQNDGGCFDRVEEKGDVKQISGYPMKLTTTISTKQSSVTTSSTVVEVSTAPIDAALFETPVDCRVTERYGPSEAAPAPKP